MARVGEVVTRRVISPPKVAIKQENGSVTYFHEYKDGKLTMPQWDLKVIIMDRKIFIFAGII